MAQISKSNNDIEATSTTTDKIHPWEWSLSISVLFVLILRAIALTIPPSLKVPWCDEILTYYQVDHHSFKELCRSLSANVNASPPQYYIFIWAVGKIFSSSIMAIRVTSAICSAAAFAITWRVLRNYLYFFPASLSVCIVFLGSDLFLNYSVEARFYGPYLLGVSLIIYSYDLLSRKANPGLLLLLFNSFCQCIAVSTSYVAGLYSAVILVALVIRDRANHLRRPWVYASFIAGWFPIVFCLNNIKGSSIGWIKKPDYYYLFHAFNPEIDISNIYYVLFILAVLVLISASKGEIESDYNLKTDAKNIAYIAVFILAIPYVVLLISWLGKPMMNDRYYFPSLIGLAMLVGIFAQKTFGSLRLSPSASLTSRCFLNALKTIILVILVLNPLLMAIHLKRNQPKPESEPGIAANSQIIVTDNYPTYLPLTLTRSDTSNLFIVVEPNLNPKAVQAGLTQFHQNLQVTDIDTLTSKYSVITLVEDEVYPEFLWVKPALLKRGYRALESKTQNKTIIWTVLSNEKQ